MKKRVVLVKDWEVKAGSVKIETGSVVYISEEREADLIKAGLVEAKKAKKKLETENKE